MHTSDHVEDHHHHHNVSKHEADNDLEHSKDESISKHSDDIGHLHSHFHSHSHSHSQIVQTNQQAAFHLFIARIKYAWMLLRIDDECGKLLLAATLTMTIPLLASLFVCLICDAKDQQFGEYAFQTTILAFYHLVGMFIAICGRAAALNAREHQHSGERYELLAALTNTLMIGFISVLLVAESFHVFYEPADPGLLERPLCFAALIVDAIAIFLLKRGIRHVTSTSSTIELALHAAVLHPCIQCLFASNTLLTLIIHADGRYHLHSVICVLSALLIVHIIRPLWMCLSGIFLQTTPAHIHNPLQQLLREIQFYDGMLDVKSSHFWSMSPSEVHATVHVRCRADADEDTIRSYIQQNLKKYAQHITVQVEKDCIVAWMQSTALKV